MIIDASRPTATDPEALLVTVRMLVGAGRGVRGDPAPPPLTTPSGQCAHTTPTPTAINVAPSKMNKNQRLTPMPGISQPADDFTPSLKRCALDPFSVPILTLIIAVFN